MDDLYAVKYPQDIYTREEQNYIMFFNKRRKHLQSQLDRSGLSSQEERELRSLQWVLKLIEEVGF
jgi:hypothetical protein